jgi:hypothetical protein
MEDSMADLIATKSMTYATRRLRAGDGFEVGNRQHSRALVALGKARLSAPAVSGPDIGELREQYTTKFSKKPYHGWDAATLSAKLAEAGQ